MLGMNLRKQIMPESRHLFVRLIQSPTCQASYPIRNIFTDPLWFRPPKLNLEDSVWSPNGAHAQQNRESSEVAVQLILIENYEKGNNTQSSTVPCLEWVLRKLCVGKINEYMRRHRKNGLVSPRLKQEWGWDVWHFGKWSQTASSGSASPRSSCSLLRAPSTYRRLVRQSMATPGGSYCSYDLAPWFSKCGTQRPAVSASPSTCWNADFMFP